jgi:molybdate transport system regulatory protein
MKNKSTSSNIILIRPRIHIGESIALGPGKIDLLRLIGETHSIAASARAMGMQYKRAWLLVESLNKGFGRPVVETAAGGKGGGGSNLTTLGQQLVACYTALEQRINAVSTSEIEALRSLVN